MGGEGLRTVEWRGGALVMIDQTLLPGRLERVEARTHAAVADAIRRLVVRGAPAIGVAGAFGMALAAREHAGGSRDGLLAALRGAHALLASTRPTAVNLRWALDRAMAAAEGAPDAPAARRAVEDTAVAMAEEDVRANMEMGRHGAALIGDGETVMTHCNAGALATVAYGTALGAIRAAREAGKGVRVMATETRPVQQGSRLTAFELQHDGIDVTLVPDTAVGHAMARGMVDRVIVGADRILATGHVFNKIGTYQVAMMARAHGVPFHVAAPLSTFDLESAPGDVTIEERDASEVTGTGGRRTAPEGVGVINPAFDVTPPELVTAIITERGVARAPYRASIAALFGAK